MAADPLIATARRFIRLYDEALKARGIHTLIGMEQEFYMDIRPGLMGKVRGLFSPRAVADGIGAKAERGFHGAPARLRERMGRRGLLKKGLGPGPVERFYLENPDPAKKDQEPSIFEITTTPSAPLRAAYRIAGLRRFLLRFPEGKPAGGATGKNWKVKKIELTAFSPSRYTAYGLHVNISLNYKSEGDRFPLPLLYPIHAEESPASLLADHLVTGLKKYSASDMLLVADNPRAYQRLSNDLVSQPHFVSEVARKRPRTNQSDQISLPGKQRVEFRLPEAGSDPYLATLMVMAAIWDQLRAIPVSAAREGNAIRISDKCVAALMQAREDFNAPLLCRDLKEARERFAASSRLVASMRTLAAEIERGDKKKITPEDKGAIEQFTHQLIKRSQQREREQFAAAFPGYYRGC